MNKKAILAAVLCAFALGNLVPYRLGPVAVQAAPSDVIGSPNVAIDTYRNSKGTYILWSSGKITSAEGGGTDLGNPYTVPPASAKIGKQTLETRKVTGSPKVAVKAIPRKDATYILFADGSLLKPANADAAAGDASASKMYAGSGRYDVLNGTMTLTCSPGCSASSGPNGISQVVVDEELGAHSQILGFAVASNTAINSSGGQLIAVAGQTHSVAGKSIVDFSGNGNSKVTSFVILDQP